MVKNVISLAIIKAQIITVIFVSFPLDKKVRKTFPQKKNLKTVLSILIDLAVQSMLVSSSVIFEETS